MIAVPAVEARLYFGRHSCLEARPTAEYSRHGRGRAPFGWSGQGRQRRSDRPVGPPVSDLAEVVFVEAAEAEVGVRELVCLDGDDAQGVGDLLDLAAESRAVEGAELGEASPAGRVLVELDVGGAPAAAALLKVGEAVGEDTAGEVSGPVV